MASNFYIICVFLKFPACQCNPKGTFDGGICDSQDVSLNIEAGQCHCKKNVMGLKCDECKPGFWNLSDSNPDGCQRKKIN